MSAFTEWSARTMAANYKRWGWTITAVPEYNPITDTWVWTMEK